MGLSVFDERTPQVGKLVIVAADVLALKQLASSNSIPYRIDNILVTNDDTIAHNVDLWVTASAVNYLLGSVPVPAGQGSAGTLPVDILATLIPVGQAGLLGDNTTVYSLSVEVAVQAAKHVYAVSYGGSF